MSGYDNGGLTDFDLTAIRMQEQDGANKTIANLMRTSSEAPSALATCLLAATGSSPGEYDTPAGTAKRITDEIAALQDANQALRADLSRAESEKP